MQAATRQKMRIQLCGWIIGVGTALGAPAFAQAPPQMPPKQVGVVELTLQEVPRVITLPGRAIAVQEVGLRPRVSGMITEILYKPGTYLEVGAPMFRLDDRVLAANVAAAEADVAAASAAAAVAQSTYERGQKLLGSGISAAELENQKSTVEQAQARVQSAQAAQELRKLELGWGVVTSPIAGMASVAAVSVGDQVSPAQATPLATITALDPIDVDLYEPSARMMRIIDDVRSGRLIANSAIKAVLRLESGEAYEVQGELVAPGFTVSTSTGAVDNRFRFANPQRRLLPGMFLRAEVELGVSKAFLVSQSAATRERTGKLTAWVLVDGKPEQRELTEDGSYQNQWVVLNGLAEGEMLVVDGISGLAPGMEVVPVPVQFDEQGVVRPLPPPEGAAPAPAAPQQGG